MGATLDEAADRWPDAVGWVFADRHVTFGQMKVLADRTARGLAELGIVTGDAVALWMPNLLEWAVTAFACYRLGAIVIPLNTRFRAFEAEHILTHGRAKALVLQSRFLNIDFDEVLEQVAPDLQVSAGGAVSSARLPDLEYLITIDDSRLGGLPWAELADSQPADPAQPELTVDPDLPCLLQYTSGTTGRPKGVLLSQQYVRNYALELWERLGVGQGDRFLNPQPLYHVGGSCTLAVPMVLGATIVIPSFYRPLAALELIERERCVARGGMGTMYLMELEEPTFQDFDLSSLKAGWTSGPPAVMDRIRDGFGIELVQLYGATEGGGTSGSLSDPWEDRRISSGKPYTGTEFKLLDPDTGEPVAVGEVGEVAIRGWSTMLGYYRDEARTREVFDDDGWLRIGDLLRQDEAGNYHFVGRLKDMIRVGGENTSAEEVEAILTSHPEIAQAQVVGVPDPKMGEAVFAFVERRGGSELAAAELQAYCRARAANFRVPKYIRFVSEWPLTGSGKIAKGELRKELVGEIAA